MFKKILFALLIVSVLTHADYNFSKVATIGSDVEMDIVSFTIDKEENIYITNRLENNILVFDKNGNLIKKIGQYGIGPGEFSSIKWPMFLDDRLFVSDDNRKLVNIFQKDGTFIEQKTFGQKAPEFLRSIEQKLVTGIDIGVAPNENGSLELYSSFCLFDNMLNIKEEIAKTKIPFDLKNPKLNPEDFIPVVSFSKKSIFVGEIDENRYLIDVFDLNGKKTNTISKGYRKIKISDELLKKMNRSVTVRADNGNDGSGVVENKFENPFHKAIQGMWVDKYDNLIVASAEDLYSESPNFDLFKDDKPVEEVSFSFLPENTDDYEFRNSISFFSDKVYFINRSSDYPVIDVYTYNLE
ncbi:MAG: 6-bladed beta-propeller [Candidatus Delongbacteria bacterium]|nr:6-bladed beta-propeller [Candidatus Delongbacteria bacterium]MBN2836561.1 6-bladed beta-propeller [Candidatus Delongbacteria bacterium]